MKVGFIGLGKMGAGICSNIVKNGIDVVVYDINPASVRKFVDMGASSAATVKELAAQVGYDDCEEFLWDWSYNRAYTPQDLDAYLQEIQQELARTRQKGYCIIFDELCVGKILPQSREKFKAVTEALAAQGAQAAILGCTEIGLLLRPEDTRVPLFDTTVLHAAAAVERALEGE